MRPGDNPAPPVLPTDGGNMESQMLSANLRRALGAIVQNAFYEYLTTFTFVGNENQQAIIQIQSDADFIVAYTVYDTNVAPGVAGAAFGGSLVQLTDGGNGRILSNAPVPASCLFGTAQLPFVWPFTHLFRANTPIQLSVTGIAAATAQVVRFVFVGFKIPVGQFTAGR